MVKLRRFGLAKKKKKQKCKLLKETETIVKMPFNFPEWLGRTKRGRLISVHFNSYGSVNSIETQLARREFVWDTNQTCVK